MTDNPPTPEPLVFALPDHRIVSLTGRDALAFAQAQFMNDVAALAIGHWQWNGWLTPKGRVIALFALLKLDEQTVWLLLQDADPAALADRLQRFVFRSKLKIAAASELRVTGAFQASQRASAAHFVIAADGAVELDLSADGGGRSLRIGAQPGVASDDSIDEAGFEDAGFIYASFEQASFGPTGFDQAWAAHDLRHGLPRLPPSQVEQWTPQQLSLDRLRAYSVKKGCYPGQEIVARTHFLGQAKRGLVLLESDVSVAIGSEVRDDARVLGSVISAACVGAVQRLLAVLPLEREGALTLGDGIIVRERALADGLTR